MACLLLLLSPAVLSGASFPLAVRMAVSDPALTARGLGNIAAVNTLGGIVGSILAGFVLLPLLGMQRSILVLSGNQHRHRYLGMALVRQTTTAHQGAVHTGFRLSGMAGHSAAAGNNTSR